VTGKERGQRKKATSTRKNKMAMQWAIAYNTISKMGLLKNCYI